MTEVYIYFYNRVLPMFTHPNLLLQRVDQCIYLLLEDLSKFMRNLCGKFLKLEEVLEADRITDVDTADQKHPADIFVGMLTKNLKKPLKNFVMKEASHKRATISFLKQLEVFFSTFEYGNCKLPLADDVVKSYIFLNFFNREKIVVDNVFYFLERFGFNFPDLHEQFLKYSP